MAEKVFSSILKFKQEDGTFIAMFPMNTVNDVYYDVDNNIKLIDYLNSNRNVLEVENKSAFESLTTEDLEGIAIVKVIDDNKVYFVADSSKVGTDNDAAYNQFITSAQLGQPGGVPVLDENGKLPSEVSSSSLEIITYTEADLV